MIMMVVVIVMVVVRVGYFVVIFMVMLVLVRISDGYDLVCRYCMYLRIIRSMVKMSGMFGVV